MNDGFRAESQTKDFVVSILRLTASLVQASLSGFDRQKNHDFEE